MVAHSTAGRCCSPGRPTHGKSSQETCPGRAQMPERLLGCHCSHGPAPNGLGKLRNLISYFTICPLRQQLLEEKKLCCSRGCLSPREQEEERQQLPLATQPAGIDRSTHPNSALTANAHYFYGERHGKERGMPKARSQGTIRGVGSQIPP